MFLTLALMFLIALLPVVNLRLSLYETLGERFLYLPTVFACLLIAYVAAVMMRTATTMILVVLFIVILYSASLYHTGRLWREAANLTQTISRGLAESASPKAMIILNAPDNLRGVPLFHNGLREAALWQYSNAAPPMQIVAFQDLQHPSDQTMISGTARLDVQALNPADIFTRVSGTDCVAVSTAGPNNLILDLKSCASESEIFFFSGGRINRLNNP